MDSGKSSGGAVVGEGGVVGGVGGRGQVILRRRGRVWVGVLEGERGGLIGGSWRERLGGYE